MSVSASPSLDGLNAIDWDFVGAETRCLTHNIHPYPAKFIPQIPNALIQELSSVGDTVTDPFCGSGTTLLEALRLSRHAIGIDANPLATLISRVKTTHLTDCEFSELATHQEQCKHRLPLVQSERDLFHDGRAFRSLGWRPSPDVCEFWFDAHVVEELAELRVLIGQLPSAAAQSLCNVAFSAIVVRVSRQDSDTRYVRRVKRIARGEVFVTYLRHLNRTIAAARDTQGRIHRDFKCTVLDANILDAPTTDSFDLVVTSPPYPNAYSYHLYHRTRLLWLGYDPVTFKAIEIGSHRKYSSKGKNRATPETFYKEFTTVFRWMEERLRCGGHACFVIGDSTIDGATIDNATLIAEAGQDFGFREVKRILREIAATRKAFNPKIGRIKTEHILVLRKE